jgi:hypothetical protein
MTETRPVTPFWNLCRAVFYAGSHSGDRFRFVNERVLFALAFFYFERPPACCMLSGWYLDVYIHSLVFAQTSCVMNTRGWTRATHRITKFAPTFAQLRHCKMPCHSFRVWMIRALSEFVGVSSICSHRTRCCHVQHNTAWFVYEYHEVCTRILWRLHTHMIKILSTTYTTYSKYFPQLPKAFVNTVASGLLRCVLQEKRLRSHRCYSAPGLLKTGWSASRSLGALQPSLWLGKLCGFHLVTK